MFSIVSTPIDSATLIAGVEDATAGAVVTFEGRVRNHHAGRQVRCLEYEAYQVLAESEGEKIIAEAIATFRIHAAVCTHRTGLLQIGDMAVVVAVSAAHRDPAFEACRFIIDELKARVPIWKKETYGDGSVEWTHATQPGA